MVVARHFGYGRPPLMLSQSCSSLNNSKSRNELIRESLRKQLLVRTTIRRTVAGPNYGGCVAISWSALREPADPLFKINPCWMSNAPQYRTSKPGDTHGSWGARYDLTGHITFTCYLKTQLTFVFIFARISPGCL